MERGQGQPDLELAEHRLRVGVAEPVEAAVLCVAAQISEAVERLRQEDDPEPSHRGAEIYPANPGIENFRSSSSFTSAFACSGGSATSGGRTVAHAASVP